MCQVCSKQVCEDYIDIYIQYAYCNSVLLIGPESTTTIVSYFGSLQVYPASAFANEQRAAYNPFHFPCSSNTYIPNERLRRLRDSMVTEIYDHKRVEDCVLSLFERLMSLQSWVYPEESENCEGSESELLHSLNLILLNQIRNQCEPIHDIDLQCDKDTPPFNPTLCGSVLTEHRLDFKSKTIGTFVMLTTNQSKGVDSSHFTCLIQALEVAADASIHMHRITNLDFRLCATPGIIVYGDVVQFYGVYLLEDFPVTVFLTPPLCYTTLLGRRAIAQSLCACADYIRDSVQLLSSARIEDQPRPLKFDEKIYFFKPIRGTWESIDGESGARVQTISNVQSRVELVMSMYDQIAAVTDSDKYILFPVGLMRIPDEDTTNAFEPIIQKVRKNFRYIEQLPLASLIVFRDLVGWQNERPPPEYVDSYIELLSHAVEVMNTAKVAHMDLHPANIMWQIVSENTLEVKIIDFEMSLVFGSKIEPSEDLRKDPRYPLMNKETLLYASEYHNNWFLVGIQSWLKESTSDVDFLIFMLKHYYQIAEKVPRD